MRNPVLLTIALLLLCSNAKAGRDTVKVGFAFNADVISTTEQSHLDALIARGRLQPNKDIKIIGYCDYVGGEGYNAALSRRRANSVKAYLISSGFKPEKIVLCVGKGKIARRSVSTGDGYAPDRRVEIVIGGTAPPATVPAPATVEKPVVAAKPPVVPKKVVVIKNTPITVKWADKALSNVKSLNELNVSQTILLNNIIFQAGSHFVLESSMPALEKLYNMLAADTNIKVRLEGHICCFTPVHPEDIDAMDMDAGDYHLSLNRARYIYYYLAEHGIAKERMTFAGYGNTRPLVPGNTQNPDDRRVEVRITGK